MSHLHNSGGCARVPRIEAAFVPPFSFSACLLIVDICGAGGAGRRSESGGAADTTGNYEEPDFMDDQIPF